MKRLKYFGWVIAVALIIVVGFILLNRNKLYDGFRGMTYSPSPEMSKIRDSLKLTDKGTFLFNASQPKLSDQEEFNDYCRSDSDSDMAVLGCYTENNIYVYNIDDEELDGILELTTAHELLHAVWARMSEGQQREYVSDLTKVFEENQEILGEEIDTYALNEKEEELFVRVGTEIKDLPDSLEDYYATIFKDQDAIVDYYDRYISVFRNLESEMRNLKAEIDVIKNTIEEKTSDYETRVKSLNDEIARFNSCAETIGCFVSEAEFNVRRNALMAEQSALMEIYNELDGLISEYNTKVDTYNEDVTYSKKLEGMINSLVSPEEIE